MAPGVAKTAGSALANNKFINNLKISMHHGHNDHLCDTLARLDREGLITPVPAGYKYLALVIRIDQTHQVTEYDAVFVTQPGSW